MLDTNTHNIKLDELYIAVLRDVKKVFIDCTKDEKTFREKVIAHINSNTPDIDGIKAEIESLEKQIHKEKQKYKRLYDDYYDGVIKSAEMFEKMSAECSNRVEMFSRKKETLTAELGKSRECYDDVEKLVKLLKRFSDITELDPEILNTLTSKIEVGEKAYVSHNEIVQNVSVNYKFINSYC